MKKIMFALALAAAATAPLAAMAEEVGAAAVSPALSSSYVYTNEKTGISLTLPENRMEDKSSNDFLYRAYLPDSGMSISVLSHANSQPLPSAAVKKEQEKAKQFLAESIRNSGEKQVSLKQEKAGGETVLLAETEGSGKEGNFSVIRYVFPLQGGTYMVSWTMKKEDLKGNRPLVKSMMDTVHFFTVMQKVSVKGTTYTYDIPADMRVDYDPPIAPDHVLVAGNRNLMTGVLALPIRENGDFSFLPDSLSSLTDAQKQDITDHFRKKLASESTGKYVKNVTFRFMPVNGRDGLVLDFDDQGDHSRSYIFVKDGKYISFDYIYNMKEKDYAEKVIRQSVSSISL